MRDPHRPRGAVVPGALTHDEIVAGLVRVGVPRAVAERQAARMSPAASARDDAPDRSESPPLPIRLTLPWSMLVSDNAKYTAGLRGGRPRLLLTGAYRAAKNAAQQRARAAMTVAGRRYPPLAVPCALVARVYVPDARPHDVANFAKCAHDAIERILIANDRWLYDVRWIRAGIDCDAPRAELELRPLVASVPDANDTANAIAHV
jgi:hypothetical protein